MPYELLLHGRHAPGAVEYQPLGAWTVPARLGSFDEEYAALRNGAGLIDFSIHSFIEVRGSDRADFLNRILTNDIKRLAPGNGLRAALLNPNGKMLSEMIVLADTEQLLLICEASRASVLAESLDRYHFTEDVQIAGPQRSHATFALQGPKVFDVVGLLFGQDISKLPALSHRSAILGSMPVRLIVHSLFDEPGVLCLAASDAAAACWESFSQRGREAGLLPAGWQALNTARIEAGVLWYGVDADETNLLSETSLDEWLISESKGCYVGQEIVARMRTYGSASKKWLGLLIQGETVPQSGDRIWIQQEEAGWVTSACYSPRLRRPIALGFLKRPWYAPGTAAQISCNGKRLAATVCLPPFGRQSSAQ
jgi:aminomethyltransferase